MKTLNWIKSAINIKNTKVTQGEIFHFTAQLTFYSFITGKTDKKSFPF